MMRLLLFLILIGPTAMAQNPKTDLVKGGAEGHGGGGDLLTNFDIGVRRLNYFVTFPDEFDLRPLGDQRERLEALFPQMVKTILATTIQFYSYLQEQAHLDKHKSLHCFAAEVGNLVWLAPTTCRVEAQLEEEAILQVARVFLYRVGVPNDETMILAKLLGKIIGQKRAYNDKDILALDKGWVGEETDLTLDRLEKKLNIESDTSTPERFMKTLNEDKQRAIDSIRERFPNKKPAWMQIDLWHLFMDFQGLPLADQLLLDLQRTPLVPRSLNEAELANQKTCALTKASEPFAPIYLVREICVNTVQTRRRRIQMLVHESAHHIGLLDEITVDYIGRAVARFRY